VPTGSREQGANEGEEESSETTTSIKQKLSPSQESAINGTDGLLSCLEGEDNMKTKGESQIWMEKSVAVRVIF